MMLLEDVLRLHLPTLYDGDDVRSSHVIRITRDATLAIRLMRSAMILALVDGRLEETASLKEQQQARAR